MDMPINVYESCLSYIFHPQICAYYPIDYNWYYLVAQKRCPFGNNFQYVLVASRSSSKVNAYGTYDEFNAYNLVKYYRPLSFEDAITIFPEWNLSIENYGFEKLWVPDDFLPKNY